jgi:hypothetical protein
MQAFKMICNATYTGHMSLVQTQLGPRLDWLELLLTNHAVPLKSGNTSLAQKVACVQMSCLMKDLGSVPCTGDVISLRRTAAGQKVIVLRK